MAAHQLASAYKKPENVAFCSISRMQIGPDSGSLSEGIPKHWPCRKPTQRQAWPAGEQAMKRPAGVSPGLNADEERRPSWARRSRSDLAHDGIGFGSLGDWPLAGQGDQEKRCRKPDKNPDDGQVERGLATGCLDGEIEGLA